MRSRPRWRPSPFANLRRFCEWWADYGQTTRCCQRATPDELQADPDRYDCERCELKARNDGLWQVNRDAWQVYGEIGRRVVALCDLRGAVLERLTVDWPTDDVLDLVQRLDVILDVLNPK